MVNELQARLHSLYNARVQLAQVGPQMAGLERYRIIASGEQLYTLLEAADRIAELEAALRKIMKFSADLDPDDNARQCGHYIESVARVVLAGSPSRPDNVSIGSAPSDATVNLEGEL
jgi:hypothetical protein